MHDADLSGTSVHRVRFTGARFRMVDFSGAVLRDVDFSGASIDGMIWGLQVNGVDVAPLVAAELARRQPARALSRATDPAALRAAWAAVEEMWSATYAHIATLPPGAADTSVDDEWTVTQTLRHLVFVADGWLPTGPYHPWGLPFTEITEFVDPATLGIDPAADPTYEEVLALRAARSAQVRAHLAALTPADLTAETPGPPWSEPVPLATCIHVLIDEECEHHRYTTRDLTTL